MPSLRQLEILVAIADTKHFKRAAESVATTQPNVSDQLKALEARLGCRLVERSRSGVLITPLGEEIVARARRVLTEVNDISTLATKGSDPLAGLLRLGLPPTIGPYLLPHIAPVLHENFPQLKLYLREEMPSRLPDLVLDGDLDGAITVLPVQQPKTGVGFKVASLFEEDLHLVVAADHPLALGKALVSRDALAREDVLTLGPGHQLHDAVHRLSDELGAGVRNDFEGTSLDTLREMVIMGLGVTFLPGLYVAREIRTDRHLAVLSLEGAALKRDIGLIWRKTSPRDGDFEILAKFLKSRVQSDHLLNF